MDLYQYTNTLPYPSFEFCNNKYNIDKDIHTIHGAFLYNNRKLVSSAVNTIKGRIFGCNLPTAHAEMNVLRLFRGSYKAIYI
jgi:tRNA(Arg) A34 adenosine deaminase TadA